MDDAKCRELLAKYLKGDCTDEERALLDQWYASLDSDVALPSSDGEKKQLTDRNWQKLARRTVQTTPVNRLGSRPYWIAAAVVLLISGLSWYFLSYTTTEGPTGVLRKLAINQDFIEHTNRSARPERVVLSDRSVVTLQPGSQLRYPVTFAAQKREVTLIGEAFFDIQKNSHQPFLVYSQDLVTKVLGTSFRIKAYPTDQNVIVSVQTGRVSVYSPKLSDRVRAKADPETIGVVLTPNQQVTYMGQQHRLVKTLVDKPLILNRQPAQGLFTFQNTPVPMIMAAIEQAYGVDIVYDEDVMATCSITTSLDGENLYDKLTIICKLLGATYKVIDAQIVITGSGC